MHHITTPTVTHRTDSDYLHRRKGSKVWYVRRRIPKELQGHSAFRSPKGKDRKELTKSTGQARKSDAMEVGAKIIKGWEELFRELSGCSLAPESNIEVSRVAPATKAERADFSFAGNDAKKLEELWNYMIGLMIHKQRVNGTQTTAMLNIIKALPDDTPEAYIDRLMAPLSDQYYEDLVKKKVRELGIAGKMSRVFANEIAPMMRQSHRLDEPPEVSFSEVINSYLRFRESSGARASTVKEVEKRCKLFATKVLPQQGETPLKDIQTSHVRAFVQIVQENWSSETTRHDVVSLLSTVCRHGIKVFGGVDRNPFEYATDQLPKAKKGARKAPSNQAYEQEQLEPMFVDLAATSLRARSQPARVLFACSVMSLYSGMRIEEICQLKADCVVSLDGDDFIQLDYSKSQAGIRKVPVNRGVALALRLCQQYSDYEYLISGLKTHDGRRSKKVSDKFSNWKGAFFGQNELNRVYTFHSFRSTAITALDRADISDEYISLLVGHSDGRKSLAKTAYSEGKRLHQLVEPASKMDYGDELYNRLHVLADQFTGS